MIMQELSLVHRGAAPLKTHSRMRHGGRFVTAHSVLSLFQCACSVSDFFDSCEANACGGFIRNCFLLEATF